MDGKPDEQMPAVLRGYRTERLARMERHTAGRSLARVLRMMLEHPEQRVLDAAALGMLCGAVASDSIRNLVPQWER